MNVCGSKIGFRFQKMQLSAFFTSVGINTAVTVSLLALYSILRKQPSNLSVYFGRKLASMREKQNGPFSLERFVPSPSWIKKAWETSEDELLAIGGMDAVVLIRLLVFSLRIFCIAAVICIFLVLPVNYYGKEMVHGHLGSEALEVFTIENVKEGSKWLWTHCFALYVISCSACVLLYFEHKSISRTRMAHITGSPPNLSHFTVLVRAVPWSAEQSYSDTVKDFFSNYYSASYLSHQIVYHSSAVRKLMKDAARMCQVFRNVSSGQTKWLLPCICQTPDSFKILSDEADRENMGFDVLSLAAKKKDAERMCQVFKNVSSEQKSKSLLPCLCQTPSSFKFLSDEADRENMGFDDSNLAAKKEYPVAFVSFKTRYAAVVAAEVLHSAHPMLWATELAPEPNDVLWSNLSIPYRQVWIRKIATLMAAVVIMLVFLLPVAFVQSLLHLEQLIHALPFLEGFFEKKFINQLVTGYLPSVILISFFYAIPPIMMLFSTVEGSVSHSGRKKSTCIKVLIFTIWNVFFANVFSGSIIGRLSKFAVVKDIPNQLAQAVPTQAGFFMTYVLTSGWASLAVEMIQPYPLLYNLTKKFVCGIKKDPPHGTLSFPYHTEVPKILLLGLLGFIYSVMVPLILPFLLIYFLLAYLVYKNQIVNVYITNYESGGQYWPIVHNTTIASLVFTQIIALGVFGLKRSTVASGFTIPLIIGTLLFNGYCRQRFAPTYKKIAGQVLTEMDRLDERGGRMEEIHQQLQSAYCQLRLISQGLYNDVPTDHNECREIIQDPGAVKLENETAS